MALKASGIEPCFFDAVVRRYGDVVRSLEKGRMLFQDLSDFWQWLENHQTFWSLLRCPFIPESWGKRIFQIYQDQKTPPLRGQETVPLSNFLSTLYQHSRMNILPSLLNYLSEHYQDCQKVYVYSPQKLSSLESQSIEKVLARKLKKQISLQTVLDPSLFPGIVLIWNDLMMDLSIKPLLTHLKKRSFHAISAS